MTLSCIIVDDEPLALSMLESYVLKTTFLKLEQKFSSAALTLQWLQQNTVDVIFLDIQMPDLNGLEIAKKLEHYSTGGNMKVIFTTAYSQYALEGYKVQAIDYLLKPFNFEDFTAAAEKARQYFTLIRPGTTEISAIETNLNNKEYIYLKVGYEVVRVDACDILYLESAKDYVKVFLSGKKHPLMAYTTLKNLFEKLPAHKFLKIHRSFIIAANKVEAVTKNSVNIAGTTIAVTENYREEFLKFLTNWR